jgi:photosystem II stability/assembly factor-like uncharacterized protein
VWAADATHIWAVGAGGTIIFSNDGMTWAKQTPVGNIEFQGVSGYDNQHVFAVGAFVTQMNINYTANAGTTWVAQNSNIGGAALQADLTAVYAGDAMHVWAVGNPPPAGGAATILHTTNGGAQWSAQTSNLNGQSLLAITGSDAMHQWAVGSRGSIVATVNGGTAWAAQTSNTTNSLNAVWAADANNVWAAGNSTGAAVNGTIINTANGGTMWKAQTSNLNGNLTGIWGSSNMNLIATGAAGSITTTANGGTAWASQVLGNAATFNGIWGSGTSDIYIVGGAGLIMHYNGSMWAAEVSGAPFTNLTSAGGSDATHHFVAGGGGAVLFHP